MLLTRSIRRKLVFGLGLVVMLFMLSTACSILGVSSYRQTVNDLELSIGKLPRRAEMISSMALLLTPLTQDFPSEAASPEIQRQAAEFQRDEFAEVFAQVRHELDDFKHAWQTLDPSLRHRGAAQVPYIHLFGAVDQRMNSIESLIPGLGDPARRQISIREIGQKASEMIWTAKSMPDPANGLGIRLQAAKADYLFHLRLVSALGVMSVLVLLGLMLWSYQLIFVPIRKLYQGVRRVADGDYGYRLRIDTQCEISHLANAFNNMAQRIQEDRATKEREIEERSKQLVLSERLAGAGFLASGVAHEINNPLSVIMTAAYGIEMRLTDEVLQGVDQSDRDDLHEYLGLIQSESQRCERITKKLLDFSYGRGDERNLYDVTAIIDEVVSMVSHLSRYQDRHVTVDRTTPLHAWVNAPEIKQVLLNLVANGLDATEPGGYVDIFIQEHSDEVEITVQDDGCGMTAEQIDHIFEPFFTTKDVGKGTGLGLAITHRIVRDHGGTLEVESDGPGHGSRFSLRLPRTEASVKAA